jgi:hypothetical protein
MKIIQALLEIKFPNADINAIMEILNATPNVELATEILCGLYVEKSVNGHVRVQHKDKGVLTFVSYNKWDNNISYSYVEILTQGAYFPKGTKKEDVTIETLESMKCSSNTSDAVYLYIPTGKTRNSQGSMLFEDWMVLPYVPSEAEVRMLAAQNMYANNEL